MSTRLKVEQYLQSYGLKQDGQGYRFNSPFRAGADGMNCVITFEGDESGAWYDHKEGIGGSLYDFAQRAGIELPQREKVENSKRGYDSLNEYAGIKGIPEQAFIDAGWKEFTYHDGRPSFVFPTRGGDRYRFADGKQPSFKSVGGFQACWYGLDKAIALAKQTNQKLIICNGEPSTIVAQYHGIAAFCMPGGENHKVTAELLAELKAKWTGEIAIALDCDDTGRKATKRFTDVFEPENIPHYVVDLMLSDKGDLADYCKLHSGSILEDFAKLPKISKARLDKQTEAKPADIQTLADYAKELLSIRKAEEKPDTLPLVLEKLQGEIDKLRTDHSIRITQSWEQVADEYQQWVGDNLKHPGLIQGFLSGLPSLDEMIGGLDIGTVLTLLAETGTGKSTTMATWASAMMDIAPGLVIPTETRNRGMFNKIVAFRTKIPTHLIRQGRLEPKQAGLIYSTIAIIKSLKGQVVECQNPTDKQILSAARRSILETGCKWVLLDSLSNVKGVGAKGIFDDVSAAADCAQELARMGLAVLSTSQVGRNLNNRGIRIPQLHDGKGSGRIEENADIVLSLYNHDLLVKRGSAEADDNFPPGTVAITCLKHRENGEAEGKVIKPKFKGGVGIFDA